MTQQGAVGGDQTALHHGFVNLVTNDMKLAGIKSTTGVGIFSHQVNSQVPHSADDIKIINGIIADTVILGQFVPTSIGGAGAALFAGRTTLGDVKTITPCNLYSAPLPPGANVYASTANKRGADVHKEYLAHARELDRTLNNVPEGSVGPVEARLLSFGKGGIVAGLAMGAYGEFSHHVQILADFIAAKRAHDYVTSNTMPVHAAKNMFKQALLRKWGLFAHRGWAHLLLQRINRIGCAGHPVDAGDERSEAQMNRDHHHRHPDCGRA